MNMKKNHYKVDNMLGGWTRIDLLLAIYDKAIAALNGCHHAMEKDDQATYANEFIQAQKCVLAIHGGLKPDQHEVAYNIARLLNFVLLQMEQKNFMDGVRILEKMREGFAEIYDEAIALEKANVIPSMSVESNMVSSVV